MLTLLNNLVVEETWDPESQETLIARKSKAIDVMGKVVHVGNFGVDW